MVLVGIHGDDDLEKSAFSMFGIWPFDLLRLHGWRVLPDWLGSLGAGWWGDWEMCVCRVDLVLLGWAGLGS